MEKNQLEGKIKTLVTLHLLKSYLVRAAAYSAIYALVFGSLLVLGAGSRMAPMGLLAVIVLYPFMLWIGYKDHRDRFFQRESSVVQSELDEIWKKYQSGVQTASDSYGFFDRHKAAFIFGALLLIAAILIIK